jgi:hypothetical protein
VVLEVGSPKTVEMVGEDVRGDGFFFWGDEITLVLDRFGMIFWLEGIVWRADGFEAVRGFYGGEGEVASFEDGEF